MKNLLLYFALFLSFLINAQIGINTTDPQGSLEISSSTDGLLIPRVALTATTTVTVTTPTVSELVYNTATVGDVTPGFYYLSTATGPWIRLATGVSGWLKTGNNDIIDGTNFLGTTTNVDLAFRRNNIAAGKIGTTNTSFGLQALASATPNNENTAFGYQALNLNNQVANTAFGYRAAASNVNGLRNVAFGHSAMASNTASDNTSIGFQAMSALNTPASVYNVAVGFQAMQNATTGTNNTFIGKQSGLRTSGNFNVALGSSALGSNITHTGNDNTILGASAGLTLRGASNDNVLIGRDAGSLLITGSNNILIGRNAQASTTTSSNQIVIGAGTTSIAYVNAPSWSFSSDKRLKDNIIDSQLGLNFLKTIRPVSYYRIDDANKKMEFGFIAQELEIALNKSGISNSGILSKTANGMFTVRYNDFLPITIKAVQEQQVLIEELKKNNEELKKINESILKRLEALEKK